ncbi:MAG: imelysin family protein [Bdellovibrionales bacterium]|nr:imelysin family protein [Bdellovibrionales bacterium]
MQSIKKAFVCCCFLGLASCSGGGGGGEGGPSTTTGGSVSTAIEVNPPTAESSSSFKLLYQAANGVIFPGYQAASGSFAAMQSALSTLCTTPDGSNLAAARNAWRAAMDAWMQIALIQFGPIGRDNGELRIQFFPDNNNNVVRSTDRLLAGADPVTSASIVNESVAAQGLPTIEYILFSSNAPTEISSEPRRCDILNAAAGNIRSVMDSTVYEWDPAGAGYVNELAGAGLGSQRFPSEQFAIEELVNEMAGAASLVRIQKLTSPLGSSSANAQPSQFESPRSQTSGKNIAQNMIGLRRFYTGGDGFGFDDVLVERGRTDLNNRILQKISSVESRANSLAGSLEAASQNGSRGQAEQLASEAADLTRLFLDDLASELGVAISFNENDGD